MKAKVIAASLLAASLFSAPAMAEVTLYGNVKATAEKSKGETVNIHTGESHIGLKGKEQLGNGLNAVFQLEQSVDFTTNKDKEAKGWSGLRDSFVGLGSDTVGTVKLGHQTTPYAGVAAMVNPNNENSFSNGFGAGTGEKRINSLNYVTPNFGGVSGEVALGMKDTVDAAGEDLRQKTGSIGVKYTGQGAAQGVKGGLAYEQSRNSIAKGSKFHAAAATAGYQFQNGVDIVGGYEYKRLLNEAKDKAETHMVSVLGTVPVGAVDLKAGVSHQFKAKVNGVKQDTQATQFGLGADYNLSKRTKVGVQGTYTNYGKIKNLKNSDTRADNSHTVGLSVGHAF